MQVNASSMMAYSDWMASNSNNVANVNTENFKATQTTLQNPTEGSVVAVNSRGENPTSLARELTDQISIENGFAANTKAIKTEDEMIGSLLDLSI
jgi:flagellar hook protein FlgE